MSFIHEDPEIRELFLIVAEETGISPALIDNDGDAEKIALSLR